MTPAEYLPIVWPLVFLVVALIITRRLATDLRPIFTNVVDGVSKSARTNASSYAIAALFGLSASLSAFNEVFKNLDRSSFAVMGWHQYLALWSKVLNPFIVAALAYGSKSNFSSPSAPSAHSTAPFPTATRTEL